MDPKLRPKVPNCQLTIWDFCDPLKKKDKGFTVKIVPPNLGRLVTRMYMAFAWDINLFAILKIDNNTEKVSNLTIEDGLRAFAH